MKRTLILAAMLAASWIAPVEVRAKTPVEIFNGAAGALVVAQCSFRNETASGAISGSALCIDPSGLFMTLMLNPRIRTETLSDFKLILPGVDRKTVKASLLGIDPESGIAFIKAAEAGKWSVIRFSRNANVAVGQRVFSVGIMPNNSALSPCLSAATVAGKVRTPGQRIYVTAGRLTGSCAPVFAEDGRAIGLVAQKMYKSYQMTIGRGRARNVRLRSLEEASYFLPVDEFVHVLTKIPTPGSKKRLPWLGAIDLAPVPPIIKLDRPGVMIDRIIPGSPAAKANLKDRDVVVGLNGKNLEKLATPALVAGNFLRQLRRMSVGETIVLAVRRGEKTFGVKIKLDPLPTQPFEAKRHVRAKLGFGIREKVSLDKYLDKKSPTATVPGLVVIGVAQRSPAAVAALQPGDVITTVNEKPVTTVATFKKIVDTSLARSPTRAITLVVRRGDGIKNISIQPPMGR